MRLFTFIFSIIVTNNGNANIEVQNKIIMKPNRKGIAITLLYNKSGMLVLRQDGSRKARYTKEYTPLVFRMHRVRTIIQALENNPVYK